ncbi:MAG TPA: 16S rRNA (guanine(966)-N(2))-methyltransferase RsmD [Bryobacteraceae bacterium]|nr:16S rRNA (guanine(966)-N(2))-methyltransferase RsmD [Bryobacteraceae bacterium]
MRVIAGEFRSRVLKSLPGLATRPTPDRLRESLFSILMPRIEGAVFIDAYAGTGAVGIEALSRGARHCIFIERSRAAAAVIRANLESLNASNRAAVLIGRAPELVAKESGDIVFLDPPYDQPREYEACFEQLALQPPSLVIAQHAVKHKLALEYGKLGHFREVRQGDNVLSFYRPKDG